MKIRISELAIMPVYEIAFVAAVVLFVALSFVQVMMRQQVHHARFGNQEVSPLDVRFSNNLFGQYGIWKLHKRAYERSGLRSTFVAASVAFLVSIMVGVCDFLYVRYGL
jgi:hypothetical protein